MARGNERTHRLAQTLQEARLRALVCACPENVLMLSGYWPVVGTAVAVATADGHVGILAPEDEHDLAAQGWATQVRTYQPSALDRLTGPADAIRDPLSALLRELDATAGGIAYEDRAIFEAASYVAMYRFQPAIAGVLGDAAPCAALNSGAAVLAALRSRLTPDEVAQMRLACAIAGNAFTSAARALRPGMRESEVAAAFEAQLSVQGLAQPGVRRAGAHVFCMSGQNSAEAGGAHARTRSRELQAGDLVLIHCNSYVDGYWTDITRTYCLGTPDARQQAVYEAVFAARAAALGAISPGACAVAVDRAARDVLDERGFGCYFTHGVGHNVGFSVISADFPPRLHPASRDVLVSGMTFNLEPAIYIPDWGGVRHCDVVTLREDGPEVLTPFHTAQEDLVLSTSAR
jgi:Xaa-Pro aminopeptidase